MTPPTKGMPRDRARGMRKGQSRAENVLWTLLRDRRAHGDKFRRQHPIHPYIADFACVDAKLIVEIDGKSHDDATQAAYDAERTCNLAASGWRVLRFRDLLVAAGIEVELSPGIMPIHSFTQVRRFSQMCGAQVPGWLEQLFADEEAYWSQ